MAGYNNYFPIGYQGYGYPQLQQFQQPIPTPQPSVQQSNQPNNGLNGIIWVQGEAGAKSYLVAPNTTVQLWDSESQTIYLKSADASGMPSIKTLDYTIRDNSIPRVPITEDYVTTNAFNALEEKFNALETRFNALNTKASRKKEAVENE